MAEEYYNLYKSTVRVYNFMAWLRLFLELGIA